MGIHWVNFPGLSGHIHLLLFLTIYPLLYIHLPILSYDISTTYPSSYFFLRYIHYYIHFYIPIFLLFPVIYSLLYPQLYIHLLTFSCNIFSTISTPIYPPSYSFLWYILYYIHFYISTCPLTPKLSVPAILSKIYFTLLMSKYAVYQCYELPFLWNNKWFSYFSFSIFSV